MCRGFTMFLIDLVVQTIYGGLPPISQSSVRLSSAYTHVCVALALAKRAKLWRCDILKICDSSGKFQLMVSGWTSCWGCSAGCSTAKWGFINWEYASSSRSKMVPCLMDPWTDIFPRAFCHSSSSANGLLSHSLKTLQSDKSKNLN